MKSVTFGVTRLILTKIRQHVYDMRMSVLLSTFYVHFIDENELVVRFSIYNYGQIFDTDGVGTGY